jgi:hypothetical protein
MSKSNTRTTLRKVEDGHNWLSDTNYVWFPFLFLKPKPNVSIDQKRIFKMAPCFGLYFNAAYFVKRWIFDDPITLESVFWAQLYWTLGFYVWFNLVTAYFWNKRASRLQKKTSS